jgi:hypothetical protein
MARHTRKQSQRRSFTSLKMSAKTKLKRVKLLHMHPVDAALIMGKRGNKITH